MFGEVAGVGDVAVGGGRLVGAGVAEQAVVAAVAPAVEGGAVVAGRVVAVAQVPDDAAGVGADEQAAEGVGDEQAVHQTGGLLAGAGVDGVELGGHHRHAGRLRGDRLLEQGLVGGVAHVPVQLAIRTGDGVVQQERVALVARPLHIAVVGDVVGHETDRRTVRQNALRPGVVGGGRGVATVDADRHGGQPRGRGDLRGAAGKRLGEGDVGGGVVPGAGARAAGAGGAVVVGLPTAILLVADLPVRDVAEGGGVADA